MQAQERRRTKAKITEEFMEKVENFLKKYKINAEISKEKSEKYTEKYGYPIAMDKRMILAVGKHEDVVNFVLSVREDASMETVELSKKEVDTLRKANIPFFIGVDEEKNMTFSIDSRYIPLGDVEVSIVKSYSNLGYPTMVAIMHPKDSDFSIVVAPLIGSPQDDLNVFSGKNLTRLVFERKISLTALDEVLRKSGFKRPIEIIEKSELYKYREEIDELMKRIPKEIWRDLYYKPWPKTNPIIMFGNIFTGYYTTESPGKVVSKLEKILKIRKVERDVIEGDMEEIKERKKNAPVSPIVLEGKSGVRVELWYRVPKRLLKNGTELWKIEFEEGQELKEMYILRNQRSDLTFIWFRIPG